MPFPVDEREKALVSCGRHCCLCHKYCGLKIEVHHIVQESEGGGNILENAIPLCFDCHADMRSYDHKHPKGTKFTTTELAKHRDNWYSKIKSSPGLINRDDSTKSDSELAKRILALLPFDGAIKFIRHNNFGGFMFKSSSLDELFNFASLVKEDPLFEFIDADLEGIKSNLADEINKFIKIIAFETYPTKNTGYNSVPSEWEVDQPERFHEVVGGLHQSAKKICEYYDVLFKTAKRKISLA